MFYSRRYERIKYSGEYARRFERAGDHCSLLISLAENPYYY